MSRLSSRLPAVLSPNPLSRAMARLRDAGSSWLDLTETNPTVVGLTYPDDLLRPLGESGGLTYAPTPAGLAAARAAVSDEYARRGVPVSPERIVLTASTSEGYAWLFKLLCDPGDEVLVPQPSYPLFDLLTGLEAVRAAPYRLEYRVSGGSIATAWRRRGAAHEGYAGGGAEHNRLDAEAATTHGLGAVRTAARGHRRQVFADYQLSPDDTGASRAAERPC
jgi:aspartate/methionine/tyrosine aminotransferase